MKETLLKFLESVQVGEPRYFAAMGIAPIFAQATTPLEYLTLDEAIGQGLFEVREVNQGGSVPNLKVVNRSGQKVLLLDGEELVGAKQNRILNADILLAEKSEIVIPVSCVERGRWCYESRAFKSGGSVAPQQLRRAKATQVHMSLARGRGFTSDQGAMWQEIACMSSGLGVSSKTDSLHDVYTAKEKAFEEYLKAFPVVQGANGFLFILNGEPFSSDLFDSASKMAKYWPKLVTSCALDAMTCAGGTRKEAPLSDLKTIFDRAKEAEITVFDSPGLGKDLRIRGKEVAGAALVYDSTVVHAELFNIEKARSFESCMGSPSERLRRREF